MPILRGAVTFARFRLEDPAEKDWKRVLGRGLKGRAFEPIDPDGAEEQAAGWVELEDHDATEFSVGSLYQGEYALFSWRVDQIRIPASAVRAEMERWQKLFEKENQRPPGKREKAEAKQGIRLALRAKTLVSTKTFDVSWNLTSGLIQIWAASRKMVDEVSQALEQAFDVKLVPLVPPLVAQALEIPEGSLGPTPALSMPEDQG